MNLNRLGHRVAVFAAFFFWVGAAPAAWQVLEGYVASVSAYHAFSMYGSPRVTMKMTVNPPLSNIVVQQGYVTSNVCGFDQQEWQLPVDPVTNKTIKEIYAALLTARATKTKVRVFISGCDETFAFTYPVVGTVTY
ncbi:hypothetical protein MNBD_GAMMA13-289 [hydrothermal vent metagenome]|uniref:Uncharacterized protein n=1 Tax=hydrothermal vent metagenome TaxID=652676 RepID=A0A3B0YP13_9ZZZZ